MVNSYSQLNPELKMKTVAHLAVDLPPVDIVSSPEGVAGIQQIAAVPNVHGIGRNGPAFAESLAEGQIEG